MSSRIDELFEQAAKLEHEVERELNTARDRWHYRIESGRIRFEQDVRTAHKRLRHSIPKYLSESNLLTVLVSPVIYSLVIPIAILDLWVTVYQWACFPVYDVDRVRRSTYVVFDRQHPGVPERDRKGQLPVLCLRQRRVCLRSGGGRPNRAVLVSDSPRQTRTRTPSALQGIRRVRRRERGISTMELPILRARLHRGRKARSPARLIQARGWRQPLALCLSLYSGRATKR